MKKKHLYLLLPVILVVILILVLRNRDLDKDSSANLAETSSAANLVLDIHDIESGYPFIGEDTSQVVEYTGFHLSYNEEFEQANWCAYIITASMINEGTADRSDNFRADTNIVTGSARGKVRPPIVGGTSSKVRATPRPIYIKGGNNVSLS